MMTFYPSSTLNFYGSHSAQADEIGGENLVKVLKGTLMETNGSKVVSSMREVIGSPGFVKFC